MDPEVGGTIHVLLAYNHAALSVSIDESMEYLVIPGYCPKRQEYSGREIVVFHHQADVKTHVRAK